MLYQIYLCINKTTVLEIKSDCLEKLYLLLHIMQN